MSRTDRSNKWKTIAALLLITTVIGFAAMAYYYNGLNNANKDRTALQSSYDSLKSADAKNNQTIISLNAQIATLNGQIATLQAQHTADQATIAALQSTVTALQSQLNALRAANITIVFTWSATAPVNICIPPFPCIHIADGRATVTDVAWANLGTTDARNAMATATFYASADASGPALCSVSGPLGIGGTGIVPGHNIAMQNDLAANNSCPTDNSLALSATASVVWT